MAMATAVMGLLAESQSMRVSGVMGRSRAVGGIRGEAGVADGQIHGGAAVDHGEKLCTDVKPGGDAGGENIGRGRVRHRSFLIIAIDTALRKDCDGIQKAAQRTRQN